MKQRDRGRTRGFVLALGLALVILIAAVAAGIYYLGAEAFATAGASSWH